MAKRQTLSVAACALALAATCLAGAIPASASGPASIASTINLPAEPNAQSLPTAAEVEAAKGDKAATDAMISRIESSLAASRTQLETAEAAALDAQDSLLTATEERDLRIAEADKARAQVKLAKTYLEQSREEVGNIAADLYRSGASSSTLGILLQDDQSNDVFYKAATMNALSQNQSQKLNSATEAQSLVTAWQDYSAAAETAAEEATANYDRAASEASSTLKSYESAVEPQRQLRDELIGHLATLQEQEEAEARKQVEQAEAAAEEEELETRLADNTVPPVEDNEEAPALGQVQPLTVEAPQELEVQEEEATEDEQQSASRVTPTPKATPEPTEEPEPSPEPAETPKAEESPQPTPAPQETPKATPKPKETPKATPKPKETPQTTPKPKETPKATPRPKATPKPAPQPKETQKPKSSNNYSAAISWAMKTASDPSKGYVFGANGPNVFDCSSFTMTAFAQSGISMPRSSTQQYRAAPQYVSLSQLRPGDLVFSSSNGGASMYHVAIYIGNGQVVHARNPSAGISVTPLSWVNNLHSKAARY